MLSYPCNKFDFRMLYMNLCLTIIKGLEMLLVLRLKILFLMAS